MRRFTHAVARNTSSASGYVSALSATGMRGSCLSIYSSIHALTVVRQTLSCWSSIMSEAKRSTTLLT